MDIFVKDLVATFKLASPTIIYEGDEEVLELCYTSQWMLCLSTNQHENDTTNFGYISESQNAPPSPNKDSDNCMTIDGPSNGTACVFPFTAWGKTYEACTTDTDVRPWCSTKVDDNGVHMLDVWGYCGPACPCDGIGCPFKEKGEV